MMDFNAIWKEGQQAYKDGVDSDLCPYDYNTQAYEYNTWLDGHDAAYSADMGE
jgi:hypothetical protein